ncbi:MAG: TOBE domain-containing protein [Chloroflexi bacterium]|nr:TOBE domain-containing protein [Chloroflexota bacterium]
MKISARNILAGKIKSIKPGAVNDEIVVKLTGGDEVVAIITRESSKNLKLSKNKKVYAIIKASNVMIGID